jgi:hypothetical protein
MFPTWALERVAYWAIFALIVLSFEKLGRNMNLNKLRMGPRIEKTITAIVILGIVLLFSWAAFHV